MKTTINLTIHAASKRVAKECLDYLVQAWNDLHRGGDAPTDTFLEYGEPKGAKRARKKNELREMTEIEMADKARRKGVDES